MSDNRTIHSQRHGYRNGHQLLASSIKLPRMDQDVVDRLSDISGPLRPGQKFGPYVTGYRLPSASHYVVAKTWQDLDAPRAGCVVTHSLFIPMSEWMAGYRVRAIFALLERLDPQADALEALTIPEGGTSLAPVHDERITEIVEALFLEERRPIVVFDISQASAITQRLLLSLWPEVRADFSVCTFALGPRKVGERQFDLAFAPNEARARFGDWSGRRIEVTAVAPKIRHRWTALIADRIFAADNPGLLSSSFPSVLRQNARTDESLLRLSLLWDELIQKASVSTNAALGLLDIANSQDVAHEVMSQLAPILKHAISLAESSPDLESSWSFLSNLYNKIPDTDVGLLASNIYAATQELALRDSSIALQFFLALKDRGKLIPEVMLRGMGDGLASSNKQAILELVLDEQLEGAIELLAASANFAKQSFDALNVGDESAAHELADAMAPIDSGVRRKLLANVLPNLNSDKFALFLEPLLTEADHETVIQAAKTIGTITNFECEAFDQPLIAAASQANAIDSVRRVALDCQKYEASDRFIVRSMRPEPADVFWLATEAPEERVSLLATQFLKQLDDYELQRLLHDQSTQDFLLTTLSQQPRESAKQLARLVSLGDPPLSEAILQTESVLPLLEPVQRELLVSHLIERILAEADGSDRKFTDYFHKWAHSVPGYDLIQSALPLSASASRVSQNLILLQGSPDVARSIAENISELVERLVRRRHDNLGENAYRAWAQLLEQADASKKSTAKAAAATWDYALYAKAWKVSPLIKASFPIFYNHLPTKQPSGMFWSDFDRKKSARRALVEAYVHSKWPPADLIFTAITADIVKKVVGRLSRNNSGKEYVAAIRKDAERLDEVDQSVVLNILNEYQNSADPDY